MEAKFYTIWMPNPKVALYVSGHFNGPRGNIALKENPKGNQ